VWKNTYRAGDDYLQENVRMKKWINQCFRCQDQGYKPEMPDDEVDPKFKNIRYRFKCLPLNADGLCDVCAEHDINKGPISWEDKLGERTDQ
jgi:hypothetical protein